MRNYAAERRWCGNKTEEITNESVLWTEADYLATVLDCRTLFAIPPSCADHAINNLRQKIIELKKKTDQDQDNSHTEACPSPPVISYFT